MEKKLLKKGRKLQIASILMELQKQRLTQRNVVVSEQQIIKYASDIGEKTDKVKRYFSKTPTLKKGETEKIAYGILKILAQKQWSKWSGSFDSFFQFTQSEQVKDVKKEEIKSLIYELVHS